MIVIDAFYADSIPFHLATLEFMELVRDRLDPGRRRRHEHDRAITGGSSQITARARAKTYSAVFPTVRAAPRVRGARPTAAATTSAT